MELNQKIRKNIKEKFKKRKKIFGGWISFEDPSIAELFSSINFDFVAIDMEHTTISNNLAKNIITSCNSKGKPCFPRPVSSDDHILKPLLDAGADGIIAPRVSFNEDVSKLINNIKYPKKGQRSFGINRAQSYGLDEKNYFKNWNDTSTCIIQIETIDGVALATLMGVPKKEIFVELDPLKSKAFGIGVTSIPGRIRETNKEMPGGSIQEGGKSASIRLGQKLGSLEDLGGVVVKKNQTQNINLSDVAKIQLRSLKPKVRTHLDGRQSLIVEVKKESEANTVVVVQKVRKLIK